MINIVGAQEGLISKEGYIPIKLSTDRGSIEARYYDSGRQGNAVVLVGGIGGDFDTLAKGLYPRICQDLRKDGISSIRVAFRHPTILEESVLDVLAALKFLEHKGTKTAGLVGHSFGGAVVLRSAVLSDTVRTVVTIATQCHGAEAAAMLGPQCSLLLIHGLDDPVLPPYCSSMAYDLARGQKRLSNYEGAGHGLDERAEEVYTEVHDWITGELSV